MTVSQRVGSEGILRCRQYVALVLLVAVASNMSVAMAQAQTTPPDLPGAFQGLSQDCDAPVRIEADTLEVRDKKKVATFLGNVRVVRGETTLRSRRLVVHYEQGAAADVVPPAPAGTASQQQIRRLEAKGGVTITQKDRTATADTGIFEMESNTAILTGNVVVMQGSNVVRGDRLHVDLTTGVSRIEMANVDGRVHALIQPGGTREDRPGNDGGRQIPPSPPKPQLSSAGVGRSAIC